MQTAQDSLTMLGLHTNAPQVFWNGNAVPNIIHIRVDWEHDDHAVRLRVSEFLPIHGELALAGISVRKGN